MKLLHITESVNDNLIDVQCDFFNLKFTIFGVSIIVSAFQINLIKFD